MRTFEAAANLVRENEVGRCATFETPFGRRLLFYADLTATGRYLQFVESWIRRVRPYYANTHTAISSTGRIMTTLREDARRVVARAVHAGDDDIIVFTGSGATAAVNKLVGLLGIRIPEPLERAYALSKHIPAAERPVVLVGPYEHHSNELPWLETIADVVEVELDANGRTIDIDDLDRKARAYANRPLKIGSFSAASNVTGTLTDVAAVARALHRRGFFACFDYAAAAPYAPIDMHPRDEAERLDAIFVSPHKFPAGPQASGVLAASRDLFLTRVPERPGGGTVDYVSAFDRLSVDYVKSLAEREEGGTPAIVGDLRAGVAFLIKEMMGAERIIEHERAMAQRAIARLARHPSIRILAPTDVPRLAILSFTIDGLHHDLVSVLLDHLFGIQNRAGCSCAGPYGHRLLGIDHAKSERFRRAIQRGLIGLKPGWVRISLPYYASENDIEFVLAAIEFVATHGADFVTAYELDWRTGVWSHREKPVPDAPPIELTVAALEAAAEGAEGNAAASLDATLSDVDIARERRRYLDEAARAAELLRERAARERPEHRARTGDADVDELAWFDFVHARGL